MDETFESIAMNHGYSQGYTDAKKMLRESIDKYYQQLIFENKKDSIFTQAYNLGLAHMSEMVKILTK